VLYRRTALGDALAGPDDFSKTEPAAPARMGSWNSSPN